MGGEDEGLIWTSKKSVSDDANQLVVRRPATPFFGHANVQDISVIMWLSPCPTEILSSFTCSNLIIISRSIIRTLMPTSSATYWPALVCFFFYYCCGPTLRAIYTSNLWLVVHPSGDKFMHIICPVWHVALIFAQSSCTFPNAICMQTNCALCLHGHHAILNSILMPIPSYQPASWWWFWTLDAKARHQNATGKERERVPGKLGRNA